jgi:hypothetical protein
MDYGFSEKRNKGKDKKKNRKRHPFRQGGQFRTGNVQISNEKRV